MGEDEPAPWRKGRCRGAISIFHSCDSQNLKSRPAAKTCLYGSPNRSAFGINFLAVVSLQKSILCLWLRAFLLFCHEFQWIWTQQCFLPAMTFSKGTDPKEEGFRQVRIIGGTETQCWPSGLSALRHCHCFIIPDTSQRLEKVSSEEEKVGLFFSHWPL
jgi:hypothetical protein